MQMPSFTLHKRRATRHLLVENKVSFNGPDTELSIYDTYQRVNGVGLDADQLLFCGMVSGKKIMHDRAEQTELFLPHESYVMPPGESVDIDFPEADEHRPTTCLTIEISRERVTSIAERMHQQTRLDVPGHQWDYQPRILHKHHTRDTQQLLEKLVGLYTRNTPERDIMVDLGISELVTRMLREQGRDVLMQYCQQSPDATGITAAIHHLESQLAQPLDIDLLCRKACMSRSRFYVTFKQQLGCTPGEFLQQRRLQSAAEAIRQGSSITSACYNHGFTDLSHFSRRFSQFFGLSPRSYQQQHHS